MSQQAFEEFFERIKKASNRVNSLLQDHQEELTTWWIAVDDAIKELNEMWNHKK